MKIRSWCTCTGMEFQYGSGHQADTFTEEHPRHNVQSSTGQGNQQRTSPGAPVFIGLIANWKITTGKFAMGDSMLVLKNWLFSAVNSKGAVSPEMRAHSQQNTCDHATLQRKVTPVATFQRGAPKAKAASRKLPGTSRIMFSVVRITTGMAMSDKAKLPGI